jgi:proteasome lid subunit RPN8/RPN11
MSMIIVEPKAKQVMIEDAQSAYPNECCGFFYGAEQDDDRTITHVVVVENGKEGDKRKRFEITPQDYMRAEQFALENGLQLLGVYHSHPDHPAVPSEHDRVAAQPYFSYIIISVLNRIAADLRSWRLNEEFFFDEEIVETNHIVKQ